MSMGGSSGGGGTQQVIQSKEIPAYEQQFSQENQDLSRSLASNPYPQYQAPLVQGFSDLQQNALDTLPQAVNGYQPYMQNAAAYTNNGLNSTGFQNANAGATHAVGSAMGINPANAGQVGQYMSPYIQQALAPQMLAMQQQLGQQQNATNASATMGGAFGDARNGVANALNNFYGNQTMAGIQGQGYDQAFQHAMSTMLGQQSNQLQGAGILGNLAGQQQAEQGLQLQGGQQSANLGQMDQQLGLNANNAMFSGGAQQQQLGQQALNTAYQQFQNQSQWPYQMLNVRESALSNSPYNVQNYTQLPSANQTAQNIGAFASLAGAANSLGGKGGVFGA